MGETLDKNIIFECPKHKIPYSSVCIQKNCYEGGLICPKCTPNSCIQTKGHKQMYPNDFYNYYVKSLLSLVNFKTLNEIINLGLEIQQKQLDLQAHAFEEWEIKMIEDKFNKFKIHVTEKIQNFFKKLIEKIENIYEDFINSNQTLKSTLVEIPDFKLENSIKFLNENKNNKMQLERFVDTIKKMMDNDKLIKYQNDLKNVIYGKYLFEHLKNQENKISVLDTLKDNINQYNQKLIKAIFPDKKGINIFLNLNSNDFSTDPRKLKYKETITNKCLKNYTIDSIFDAYIAFDGNTYLASSLSSPLGIQIYDLSNNKLVKTFENLKQIYIIRHYPQFSTKIDYLLTTTIENSLKVYNLSTYKEYLTINNCYPGTYMYSALILFDHINNENYIVTSSPNDYIKLWNFENGKFVRNIGTKKDYTYFLNSWKNEDTNYIINANADNIKIYGIKKENELFGEYTGPDRTWHMSAFVEKINGINILFESDGKGYVRMWNLEKNEMIKDIRCPSVSLRGLCLWNRKYLIAASSDKSFKIFDLEKEQMVASISGQHFNSLCTVKKILHPKYGESLLTGSVDGNIKLWVNSKMID